MRVSSLIAHSALALAVGLAAVRAAAGSEAGSSQVEGASQAAAESFDAGEANVTCGVRALAIWLRLLGHEVEYDEVLNYVPVGEQGSSLAQLAEGAERWTRTARLVKAGRGDLDRYPVPMIAHGWADGETGRQGHYVVIVKVTPEAVGYIDAGRGLAREVARSEFETFFWSGYLLTWKDVLGTWNRYLAFTAMVLAALCGSHMLWEMLRRKRPVAAAALLAASLIVSGCGERSVPGSASPEARAARRLPLICPATEKNLGIVPLGESARAAFTLSNVTERALDLSLGRPSCGCLSASLSEERVEPHGSVELALVLTEAGGGAGRREGSVTVGVAGSDDVVLVFRASGLIEGMRTDPYTLRFPADLAGFSPPPIRGEIILGPSHGDSEVRIVEAIVQDPVALKDQQEALKDPQAAPEGQPGDHFLELGLAVLGDLEKMGTQVRHQFRIPVGVVAGRQPEARMYQVRITYRVGDRTADHHLRLPMFPEAAVPPQAKVR